MLPFLLPNSVSRSRSAVNRASTSLRTLTRTPGLQSRSVAHSSVRRYAADAAEEHEDNDANGINAEEGSPQGQGEHVRWLLTQGAEFRRPRNDGPNWIGGNVPFPMNPSFKPPPPISDQVRTQIFNSFMVQGKNEIELSKQHGLSVSRIKAILRLKKLEQLWVKEGRICQRRFQMDMEGYLGVSAETERKPTKERDVANGIDIDVDSFAIGQSKRLQRVFYEVVPEGEQPPLAQYMDLQQALAEEARTKEDEKRLAAKVERAKALVVAPASLRGPDGRLFKSATKYKWFYPAKAGRPPYTFVDVGNRYLKGDYLARVEQKEKKAAVKQTPVQRMQQLKQTKEAHQLALEIRRQERVAQELSRNSSIRDKRRELAQRELTRARAKAPTLAVTL